MQARARPGERNCSDRRGTSERATGIHGAQDQACPTGSSRSGVPSLSRFHVAGFDFSYRPLPLGWPPLHIHSSFCLPSCCRRRSYRTSSSPRKVISSAVIETDNLLIRMLFSLCLYLLVTSSTIESNRRMLYVKDRLQ